MQSHTSSLSSPPPFHSQSLPTRCPAPHSRSPPSLLQAPLPPVPTAPALRRVTAWAVRGAPARQRPSSRASAELAPHIPSTTGTHPLASQPLPFNSSRPHRLNRFPSLVLAPCREPRASDSDVWVRGAGQQDEARFSRQNSREDGPPRPPSRDFGGRDGDRDRRRGRGGQRRGYRSVYTSTSFPHSPPYTPCPSTNWSVHALHVSHFIRLYACFTRAAETRRRRR